MRLADDLVALHPVVAAAQVDPDADPVAADDVAPDQVVRRAQEHDPVALVALDQVPADGVPVGPLVEDDAVVAVGEGAVPAHHPVGHVLGEHDPMGAVAVRLVALHHQPPAAGVRVEPVELVVAEDVAPEHQALGLVGVGAEEVVVEHRVGGPAGGAAPVHPVGRGPVGPEVGEGRADDPEVGPVGVLDERAAARVPGRAAALRVPGGHGHAGEPGGRAHGAEVDLGVVEQPDLADGRGGDLEHAARGLDERDPEQEGPGSRLLDPARLGGPGQGGGHVGQGGPAPARERDAGHHRRAPQQLQAVRADDHVAAGGPQELLRRPEDVEGVRLQPGHLPRGGGGLGRREQPGGPGGQQQGRGQGQGGRAPEAGARPEHQDALASDAAAGSPVRTTGVADHLDVTGEPALLANRAAARRSSPSPSRTTAGRTNGIRRTRRAGVQVRQHLGRPAQPPPGASSRTNPVRRAIAMPHEHRRGQQREAADGLVEHRVREERVAATPSG